MSETRRHNGFGVDLSGSPNDLDRAFVALNAYPALVDALTQMVAACQSLDDAIQGRAQGGEQRQAEAAIAIARDALRQAGRRS